VSGKKNVRKIFADNLIHIRKGFGLSQKAFAVKVGLTHNFINDIEKGNKGVSIATIERLSETLDVEPFRFFIDPAQWDKKDRLHYMAIVDELNQKVNMLFDNYREIGNKK